MSSYHLDKIWSIYQHVDSPCDLDFWQIDLKVIRDHLHSYTNVCTKFDEPRSILSPVIIRIRFGLYINMLTVTVTFICDQLTSKAIGIIYTPRGMSMPNLTNLGQLCLVIIRTRFSLPTDRLTNNMSKAIYPHFVEWGHENSAHVSQYGLHSWHRSTLFADALTTFPQIIPVSKWSIFHFSSTLQDPIPKTCKYIYKLSQ